MPAPAQQAGDDRIVRQVEAFAAAFDAGRFDEAAALGARALAASREAFGDDAGHTGLLLMQLARTNRMRGALDDAEAQYQEARAIFADAYGEDHVSVIEADLGLAGIAAAGDPLAASALYAAVVARLQALAQPQPVLLANAQVALGRNLLQIGNESAARTTLASAVGTLAAGIGPYHPMTAQTRAEWAALIDSPWVAAETYVESWRALRAELGDAHPEAVQLGMVAAKALLALGLAQDALDVALPVAAARPTAETRDLVGQIWQSLRDPDSVVRAIRSAAPSEEADTEAQALAAARLAAALVRLDRPVDAVLGIDRARRLWADAPPTDPGLAEAMARISDPAQSVGATVDADRLLDEAAAIVERLDATHPRRNELMGLIALSRARHAAADDRPEEAVRLARAQLDVLTGRDDPRGVLRLRLRAAQAYGFFKSGQDNLAVIAFNGLERDVTAAPAALEDARADDALLLTPPEAVTLLEYCSAFWLAKARRRGWRASRRRSAAGRPTARPGRAGARRPADPVISGPAGAAAAAGAAPRPAGRG
ncbi:MAG: tetratricopeptide repeat protein [Alphaproteobacteria bacterium]